jgi:HEAT repeat protein
MIRKPYLSLPRVILLMVVAASCGCGKTTADLIAQLSAEDAVLRLEAVHALQERVDESATIVPALASALQDRDTYVRRDAARALAHFGPSAGPEAVPSLLAALRDKEPSVRKSAATALKNIDPNAAAKAGVR